MVLFQRGKWSILCTNIKKLPIWERLCKTSEISVRTENVFFYLTFTQTGLVFGFLIYLSVCLSVCLSLSLSLSLSGHKWSATYRVLKCHKSKMSIICYHENNVPFRLSPQWLCGNSCAQVHELPQIYIIPYIYMYIYIISTDTCFFLPRIHQCGSF